MNENKKLTFLPVGSVVRLKGGERNVIIIGYTPIEAGKTEMWDYLGGMWPTGVITSDRNLLFNRDQIEEVIFEGFTNEVELDFRTKLEDAVSEVRMK
jgi:hypothetical protein